MTFPPYFKRKKLFYGRIGETFHQLELSMPARPMKARRNEEIRVAKCACGKDFGLSRTHEERESAYNRHIHEKTAEAVLEKNEELYRRLS